MIRTYPPSAVRAERSEGIARRAEQAVRGGLRGTVPLAKVNVGLKR